MLSKNLFVLMFFFSTVFSTNTGDNSDDNELGNAMTSTAMGMNDPKIAATIDLLKNIKTETSDTIGEVHDAKVAFYAFDSSFEYASGAVASKNLDRLLHLWLDEGWFSNMPSFYKNLLAYTIKELALQLERASYMTHRYSIHFEDGKGTVHMMIIELNYDEKLGGIRWTRQTLDGGFVPARDWVIVTHSKSNLFSAERKDEIVYLPPVMHVEHVQQFVDINKQMLVNFYHQFISPP